jgi:hypothetical protein
MAKQRHTPEQIIGKLREAEVEIARGGSVAAQRRRARSSSTGSRLVYGRTPPQTCRGSPSARDEARLR